MAIDLNALKAEDTELPKGTRGGTRSDNSTAETWVQESYDNKRGKAVTVPAAAVRDVVSAIRRAGADLGIGTRIVLSDKNGERLYWFATEGERGGPGAIYRSTEDNTPVPANLNVTVKFQGKDMRQRRTKAQAAADGEVPTE